MIGTTISDFVSMLHARYRGSALTSSTTIVVFSVAAAPQMPRPSGMRVCGDGFPRNGPSTSSSPSTQVDADPRVVRHLLFEHRDRALHRADRVRSRREGRRSPSRGRRRVRLRACRLSVQPERLLSVLQLAEQQDQPAEDRHELQAG